MDDTLVARAEAFAFAAHAGQLDKAGADYIDHPRRVAERVIKEGYGAEFVAAAWLHDVVEDHRPRIDFDLLRRAGFPPSVVEAVDALSKRVGPVAGEKEDHAVAVERACQNPIALVVKAADVADNSDPGRLAKLAELPRKLERQVCAGSADPRRTSRAKLPDPLTAQPCQPRAASGARPRRGGISWGLDLVPAGADRDRPVDARRIVGPHVDGHRRTSESTANPTSSRRSRRSVTLPPSVGSCG